MHVCLYPRLPTGKYTVSTIRHHDNPTTDAIISWTNNSLDEWKGQVCHSSSYKLLAWHCASEQAKPISGCADAKIRSCSFVVHPRFPCNFPLTRLRDCQSYGNCSYLWGERMSLIVLAEWLIVLLWKTSLWVIYQVYKRAFEYREWHLILTFSYSYDKNELFYRSCSVIYAYLYLSTRNKRSIHILKYQK